MFFIFAAMEKALDFEIKDSPVEFITEFPNSGIRLFLKREDLLHSWVSGNKFRKLKYNLLAAQTGGQSTILTFGGAFSNHIAAVAAAGKLLDFKTIGVIRGEELGKDLEETLAENSTLKFAAGQGMEFIFISREEYRKKEDPEILEKLKMQLGDFFLIPEGGTNNLAVKGCEEILNHSDKKFDYICCAVGTGGTISGIINSSEENQMVLGFPALKGDFLTSEIKRYSAGANWKLVNHYHFGGYAKVSSELIQFINDFKQKYHIPLDPVYTGKMLFGIFDMIENEAFPEKSSILAVHTGGLQGIAGMNNLLKKKNLPLIHL